MFKKWVLAAAAALALPLSGMSAAMAQGVGPFGLSIGTTTVEKAKESLGEKTQLQDTGTNKWSKGPMLESNGDGLGLDRLENLLLIFDAKERLVGAILTMPKSRYDDIRKMISAQYELASANEPFVGDKQAFFNGDEKGEVRVDLDAPHLGFDMELRYLHTSLIQAFNAESAKEQKAKEEKESSLL